MESRRIVAVFDTRDAAEQARQQLLELGLTPDQVSVVDQSSSTHTAESTEHRGGFWAHVKEMFMPDQDRATLDESLRRGGVVLTARTPDELADSVVSCLDQAGAVDLDQRESEWRSSGWPGGSPESRIDEEPASERSPARDANAERIPVVEEQLRVGKREVQRGSVRVRSYMVEEPVHEEVRLREERVRVERRPVDAPARPVAQGSPEDLMQERTIEVTETGEEPVIGKEARIREEVVVTKETGERVESIDDSVRRTQVDVDDQRTDKTRGSRRTADPDRPDRA